LQPNKPETPVGQAQPWTLGLPQVLK
jgi:hypothetical protein